MLKPATDYFVISVDQLAVPDYFSNRNSTHWHVAVAPDHGLWSKTIYSGPCPKVAAKAVIRIADAVFEKGYGFSVDAGAGNDNGRAAPVPRPAA